MGILELFGGRSSIEMQGESAFSAAALTAIELCQHGPISAIPGGIRVNDAMATMSVTAALLHAMMFCVGYDYSMRNLQLPRETYMRLFNAICHAGDRQFNGAFSRVWEFSNKCIHAHDAESRIMQDGNGDGVRIKMSMIVECVNWALQALNGGVPSQLMILDQAAFLRVAHAFDVFCMRISPDIKL